MSQILQDTRDQTACIAELTADNHQLRDENARLKAALAERENDLRVAEDDAKRKAETVQSVLTEMERDVGEMRVRLSDAHGEVVCLRRALRVCFVTHEIAGDTPALVTNETWLMGILKEGIEAYPPRYRGRIRELIWNQICREGFAREAVYKYDPMAPVAVRGVLNPSAIPNDMNKETLAQLLQAAGIKCSEIIKYVPSIAKVWYRLNMADMSYEYVKQAARGDTFLTIMQGTSEIRYREVVDLLEAGPVPDAGDPAA